MEEYQYYVSFVFFQRGGYRYGNAAFARKKPIRDYTDIQRIQSEIAEKGGAHSVTVISWQRFECGADEAGVAGG